MRLRRVSPLLTLVVAAGCTNTDLYQASGELAPPPDRVTLTGELCTEDTTSDSFAVKVLLVADISLPVFRADPDGYRICGSGTCVPGSLQAIIDRNQSHPNLYFGFIGLASTARALPPPSGQRFFRPQDAEVAQAITLLQLPPAIGASGRDVVSAIAQVEAFINADMQEARPGEVLRTRYLVHMWMGGPPQGVLDPGTLAEQVERVSDRIYARGALQFALDIAYLYYGPQTLAPDGYHCYAPGGAGDPACACDAAVTGGSNYCGTYCDIQSGYANERRNDLARNAYSAMAFAGGGRYTEIGCPQAIDWGVSPVSGAPRLVKKDIVAFNENVRPTTSGPLVDSDGDGSSDAEERLSEPSTDPVLRDTDGDGLGDRLELRSYPRQDPTDPTDRPISCPEPGVLGGLPDSDADGLNDCEEGLLQTSSGIPDTDGDGLPDLLELLAGTVPTSAQDRLLDFDGDGIPNGREVVEHSNPRSNDGPARGRETYAYTIGSLGTRAVASMADPVQLPAVTFQRASDGVVGGQAYLRWDPCARTLSWSDPRINATPPLLPQPVAIDAGSGVYRLTAATDTDGASGDGSAGGQVDEAWIEVQVIEELLPACGEVTEVVAQPLISVAERSCYDVRISNIKLLETLPGDGEPAGHNRILVFFTQAPENRIDAPGIAQVARVRVLFTCRDPNDPESCVRAPREGVIELTEDQFVSLLP